ncbi:hypothetical protein FKM52_15255 [Mixta tenebrionis]|uniref:Uncharacterized protein n=2 Tax=Gammaproteobacteria TaxID=1236 RepID=A0A506V5N4_9GAMM|nr:hypothetical protein HMPREF9692_03954 [Klebsiella oxytoca 10-5248]MCQ3849571.1 hypothetical protein [Klebsiella variicola]OFV49859.1 hypothetical protein HMPREF3178_13640 [Klebsiella sp. HMSC09D12]TPW41211.1 hypothetical protein FKM52_15255 [Mixta tenebrionis]TXU95728.1 hypothetical protein D4M90_13415 [Klebsiella oxytoca]
MSVPMKGLSKRGSYNHLTDSMQFKYFDGQIEISEATYKSLSSGSKPKPTVKPSKAITTYKVKPKPTIEQQRDTALKEAIRKMTGGR